MRLMETLEETQTYEKPAKKLEIKENMTEDFSPKALVVVERLQELL